MELYTSCETDGLSAAHQISPPFMMKEYSAPCQKPFNRILYESKKPGVSIQVHFYIHFILFSHQDLDFPRGHFPPDPPTTTLYFSSPFHTDHTHRSSHSLYCCPPNCIRIHNDQSAKCVPAGQLR